MNYLQMKKRSDQYRASRARAANASNKIAAIEVMRKNERLLLHIEIATAKRRYDDALGRKIAECKGTRTNF